MAVTTIPAPFSLAPFTAPGVSLYAAGQQFFAESLGLALVSPTSQALPPADLLGPLAALPTAPREAVGLVRALYYLGQLDAGALGRGAELRAGQVGLNFTADAPTFQEVAAAPARYEGIAVLGVELTRAPTRAELVALTRTFNRAATDLPVLLLARYLYSYPAAADAAPRLSVAASERTRFRAAHRPGEKVTKVSVLYDIDLNKPHAGHERILRELRVGAEVLTLEKLYQEWNKTLSLQTLNKRFYTELSNWYFWAVKEVSFPAVAGGPETEERHKTAMIRLITRLIFVWFLKEKKLVPDALFDETAVDALLDRTADKATAGPGGAKGKDHSTYYKAILQNLFFATLNTEMGPGGAGRDWRPDRRGPKGQNDAYGEPSWLRHRPYFRDPARALALFRAVPFLNGGLFECLDTDAEAGRKAERALLDCFSEGEQHRLHVPDYLFFGTRREVDLSTAYGAKKYDHEAVRGLIELLDAYKFTVAENTPLEEEVALDPELLGRVFENLLASYNPETQTTARAATGSFYTPREVVEYMVDESLVAYLAPFGAAPPAPGAPPAGKPARLLTQVVDQPDFDIFGKAKPKQAALALAPATGPTAAKTPVGVLPVGVLPVGVLPVREDANRRPYDEETAPAATLRALLRAPAGTPNPFDGPATERLIQALNDLKLLDPACGSGAFPMGALQRLVHLLGILDPRNLRWKQAQLRNAEADEKAARAFRDDSLREKAVADAQARKQDIVDSFESATHELDYARKLYLIENCLYGSDIQPIAAQITKLRCFITLVADQQADPAAPNFGIRPLPNLETHFVAANTLLQLPTATEFTSNQLEDHKEELRQLRHEYFTVKKRAAKLTLKARDRQLRATIAAEMSGLGFDRTTAGKLAGWDPYNLQQVADFFEPRQMLGVRAFDIVIGNPPYVRQERIKDQKPAFQRLFPQTYAGTADLYVYFYERAWQLLNPDGVLCFISPNKFFRTSYGAKLRAFLTQHTRLIHLLDFGDAAVFDAIAYPAILLTQRADHFRDRTQHHLWAMRWDPTAGVPVELFVREFEARRARLPQTALAPAGWSLEAEAPRNLLAKLRATGTPLGEFVNKKFYRGILTGFNEAFVLKTRAERDALIKADPKSAELIKPYLRGRDVKKWAVKDPGMWLIVLPSSENARHSWTPDPADKNFLKLRHDVALAEKIFARTYPGIHARFVAYRDELINREDQGWYWWELRSCAYYAEFEKPKIVYQEIATYQAFAYDADGFYTNNKVFIIPTENQALLTILNSKVVWWFLNQIATKMVGGALAMQTPAVGQIPIPELGKLERARLVASAQAVRVTWLKDPTADVKSIEAQIDALIYQLYALTPAEIALVEGTAAAAPAAPTLPDED